MCHNRSVKKYGLFAALVAISTIVQWFLFRAYILREFVGAYPVNHDQTAYLSAAYQAFDVLLNKGVLKVLFGPWIGTYFYAPNGVLMQYVEAPCFFALFGASRLAALSINFVNYILFQLVFCAAVHRMTKSIGLCLAGLGFLLAFYTPFLLVGGVADFRLDFSAFCLFGTYLSLLLGSGVYRNRCWAVCSGLAAGMLILTRYLTVVYVGAIYGILGVVLLGYGVVLRKQAKQKPWSRFTNLGISAVVTGLICGAPLWFASKTIYYYYCQMDTTPWRNYSFSMLQELLYYPRVLCVNNLGLVAAGLLGMLFVAMTCYGWLKRKSGYVARDTDRASTVLSIIALLVAFFLPLIVLTFQGKTLHVSSILVPPCLWGAIYFLWLVGRRSGYFGTKICLVAGLLSFGVGVLFQFTEYTNVVLSQRQQDVSEVMDMYDTIIDYCERTGLDSFGVSSDSIRDYLVPPSPIGVRAYEKYHRLLKAHVKLGQPYAVKEDEALRLLDASDVVFLTYSNQLGESPYPFTVNFDEIRPVVNQYVKAHFDLIKHYNIYGRDVDLFVRPVSTHE